MCDPFAPLSPLAVRPVSPPAQDEDRFEPLQAPDDVDPPAEHGRLGAYVRRWSYIGADGLLQGYVCRFETPEKKDIRPLRYGRCHHRVGWHWKGWEDGRPLYRLPELLSRAAAEVVVVEGEKAADAAADALPACVVVSPMNGAQSPGKTDWQPVAGRTVTIWPDADGPGAEFARNVAGLCRTAGAADVRIVVVPEGATMGWDLADAMPEGWTEETIATALAQAAPFEPDAETQGSFRVLSRRRGAEDAGLYRLIERKDDETGETITEWWWFASRIDVEADTRNDSGEAWGRLLAIYDRDGVVHRWAMPMSMMAGSGEDYRKELLHLGMVLSSNPKARQWLGDYLQTWRPSGKARCVDRIGWHRDAFVLPDQTYGDRHGERVLLQTTGAAPQFRNAGTFEDWKNEIALPAAGNARLMLAICAALAGPTVHLTGEESGGFHFFGASSIGKTVTLHTARSVWGVPLASWRTTDNGAEALAQGACDTLLTLDEIGQAPAQVVEALAYLLGNGRGKTRMRRDAMARSTSTWRLLFLSTGELGLASKLAEGGKRVMAGQAVRVVEIPADAGAGMGIFDNIGSFARPADLAEHLRLTADRHCGHAGRVFVERLSAHLDEYRPRLREARDMFIAEHCPTEADGQVRRVCGRFGLVAAAGELATWLEVLPWNRGEAEAAAARCFSDWLRQRGGTDPQEITAGLRQVRLFLQQHGSSRFEPAWVINDQHHVAGYDPGAAIPRTMNRAGFRQTDGENNWEYYVLSEAWVSEVCKGFDHRVIAKAMILRGWMEQGDGKNLARRVRVPGTGSMRLYNIRAAFLAGDTDADC